jgi:hypothetical protein
MVPPRRKLGELLLAAGVVDEEHLRIALSEQKRWGGKLGRTLIDLGYVREEIMVKALSHQLKLPSVKLTQVTPAPEAVAVLPVHHCDKYGIFPVAYDVEKRSLSLATSDPTNDEMFRDLRLEFNLREVLPLVAGTVDIDRAIRRYYYGEMVEGSVTATPQQLGLTTERVIDLASMPTVGAHHSAPPLSRPMTTPKMAAAPRPPTASMPAAQSQSTQPPHPSSVPQGRLADLGPGSVYTAAAMLAARPPSAGNAPYTQEQMYNAMQRIEKLLSAEVRSLRTLVELLVEKGLIDRDEYLRRVKSK